MITKINDCEIKHQPNTNMFFLELDNLIKDETELIIKLNFQLIHYLKDEIKETN